MSKKIRELLLILLFGLILFCFFKNPMIIINSVNYGTELFLKNIFPSLFPFFIISEILISYNIIYYVGNIFKNTICKLFNIREEESFVFILCMLCGQPSNAKFIKDLLRKKKINDEEATNLLSYSFFPNPMFIIGTIGLLLFKSYSIGVLILVSIFASNIIMGIAIKDNNTKTNNFELIKNKKSFGGIVNDSIINAVNTLLLILGSIILFVIFSNVVNELLNFSPLTSSLFTSILEITNGTEKINALNLGVNIKLIMTIFFLSLGGLCIHTQVSSILDGHDINYKKVIKRKIIGALVAVITCIILLLLHQALHLGLHHLLLQYLPHLHYLLDL